MANKYPGYCTTCARRVGAGHGTLTRSASGAWVVQCSASSTATAPAQKPARSYSARRFRGSSPRERECEDCTWNEDCGDMQGCPRHRGGAR
jgi:hypothetical protein